jgi:Spy/CpxP family protein refolding chaperone
MEKRIIVSILLIGTLMSGGIAVAKPYNAGHGNFKNNKGQAMMTEDQHQQRIENRLQRMDVVLDLNDKQEDKIKTLFSNQWQERQSMHKEMREGREERRTAMRSGDLDETAIRNSLAKRAKLQADQIVKRAQMKKELYAVLTTEQQEKAEKIWETRDNDGRGRHAKGLKF